MAFYLQIYNNGNHIGPWDVGKTIARRLGNFNPPIIFKAANGKTPFDIICEKWPKTHFVPLKIPPGSYYPRIARPLDNDLTNAPANPGNHLNLRLIENSRDQIESLRDTLVRLCRVIHPEGGNLKSYGSDIRNIIIMAATEVEAQWKGVLLANRQRAENTKDYFKLLSALKLDEYEVSVSYFPWLKSFKPFSGWAINHPTKSLPWYDAYNAIKHNRENEFKNATLANAFSALTACAVMMYAQFGTHGYQRRDSIDTFFKLKSFPKWHFSEAYCPRAGRRLNPILYPF
ncbi:MAG: hypothetical protein KIT15_16560 [Xanthobacteraceae bacterium]|nr:hypothetical protein [Xanthobacteraceae bacterium]